MERQTSPWCAPIRARWCSRRPWRVMTRHIRIIRILSLNHDESRSEAAREATVLHDDKGVFGKGAVPLCALRLRLVERLAPPRACPRARREESSLLVVSSRRGAPHDRGARLQWLTVSSHRARAIASSLALSRRRHGAVRWSCSRPTAGGSRRTGRCRRPPARRGSARPARRAGRPHHGDGYATWSRAAVRSRVGADPRRSDVGRVGRLLAARLAHAAPSREPSRNRRVWVSSRRGLRLRFRYGTAAQTSPNRRVTVA